jgi:hypothetical protein
VARLDTHVTAICLPIDPDRIADLAVNDGSTTGSSYTEANPRPGVSVPRDDRSRLVPVISGGQGEDVEIVVLKAGNPGLSTTGDCEVGYRLDGEADSKIRGWCPPNFLLGWGAPVWTAVSDYDRFDLCVIPTNQKIVVTYGTSSSLNKGVAVFDPATWTWDADDAALSGTLSHPTDCILALPTGRLVLMASTDTYRSDDDGATWTDHGHDVLGDFGYSGFDRGRMAYANGSICLVLDDGSTVAQFASDDLAGSFTLVYDSGVTNVGTSVCVQPLPTGGFVVGYVRASDDQPSCRIISSAWQSIEDATEIVISANACDRMVIVADPDGMLWAYSARTASPQDVHLHYSVDGGLTWADAQEGAFHVCSTTADYLDNWAAASWQGGVAFGHNWVASTGNEDGSIGVAQLGGWSGVTAAKYVDDTGELWTKRVGFGPSGGGHTNVSWLPIELPSDSGLYTATGAGTAVLSTAGVLITTIADTKYYDRTLGTATYFVGTYTMAVASGGSTADDSILFGVRVADGTNDHELHIRHSTTGFVVHDSNAGSDLATVTTSLVGGLQFVVRIYEVAGLTGDSAVYYRALGATAWTEAWSGNLQNDAATPAANGFVRWGHAANSTSTSKWNYVCEAEEGIVGFSRGSGVSFPALGRPITHLPIPLPEEVGDGTDSAWLSVVAGPGALGEIYDLDADHDHPVEHLIPTLSPSPAEKWRSTSKSQQIITWDFGASTWIGDSIALVVLGANFETVVLESYNGASWDTEATMALDTGFRALGYSLTGDTLNPSATTLAGSRYLQEGELAGGRAIITTSAGATQIARRIKWNTAGTWTPSSAGLTARARIILEDVDGTEDTSGTNTLYLCSPNGVLVHHEASILRRRYWRARIAANQVTPESYYEAGCICPMAVRALGAPPDWGWSRERLPNVEVRRSRYGTTRARRLGPVLETWTMGWPSGTDQYGVRNTTAPDYLGSSVGLPLVAAEDVGLLLGGLLELADSGAVPVCALAELPDASGTTITDPTAYLVGRLSASVRMDHMVGEEDEGVYRVADIVVEKLV